MAHYAQLDENNVVLQVIVVHNDDCMLNGVEDEERGELFCKALLGIDTIWKKTSYNASIRKNYAGVGYTYDSARDAFIAPQPFASWTLNEDSCCWEAPVHMPTDGKNYFWDEPTTSWVEVV